MNFLNELQPLYRLLLRLLLLYAAMVLCRLLFWVYNADAFSGLTGGELLAIFFYALRFDTSSLLYVNALFILLHILPLPWRDRKGYERLQKGVFYCSNLPMFFLELSDVAYFPFAFRRMLRGDFHMQSDIKNLLPQFLSEFWWLIACFVLLIVLLEMGYRRTQRIRLQATRLWVQLVLFPICIGLVIIGMRGGLQLRPLMPQAAAQYVSDTRFMPLVSNTTLQLIHSFQQTSIQPKNYLPESELAQLFPLEQRPRLASMQRLNVVFLVIESFGCEYIGYFHPDRPSHTPFLDSLLSSNKGLVFNNMYANGTRSTQGIVAIAGGFPSLMNDPFMFSSYQSNALVGMGNLLQKEGYETGFFHGGEVGTMDFDKFAKVVGFQHYHGRSQYIEDNDYPAERDYDGNWGVWDIPFYQYTLQQLNGYREPFFATIFTINPHHPFNVPADFEAQHPDTEKLWRAVRYADTALRFFWQQAQQQSWFQRTLFAITADHIGPVQSELYQQRVYRYRIPLWLHAPADTMLRGVHVYPTQQIDIQPTVLQYLGYPHPYPALGSDQLDSMNRRPYSYTYESGIYQIMDATYSLQFDGEHVIALFDHQRDPLLQQNRLGELPEVQARLEKQLKAAIQTHHRVLITNEWREGK